MTAGLPLIKSVLTPSAKSVLIALGLSAADAAIQKKIYRPGRPSDLASRTTVLIIPNEKMDDLMKKVKSPEQSGLLIQGISETIKNEVTEEKGGFLLMLIGTLAASNLGNALTEKGVITVGERVIITGQNL